MPHRGGGIGPRDLQGHVVVHQGQRQRGRQAPIFGGGGACDVAQRRELGRLAHHPGRGQRVEPRRKRHGPPLQQSAHVCGGAHGHLAVVAQALERLARHRVRARRGAQREGRLPSHVRIRIARDLLEQVPAAGRRCCTGGLGAHVDHRVGHQSLQQHAVGGTGPMTEQRRDCPPDIGRAVAG
jgi:hypothetical protein